MQFSNKYIVAFAAAVCLVCSVVVAVSAVGLRERQDANKILDRQKKVLTVAGLIEEDQAVDPTEVDRLFAENIEARVIDLETGAYDDAADALTYDQRKALKDPALSRQAPANNAGVQRLPNDALVYLV
ncbi:MAG: Na(+)-translocating NADH-quinone reductase subunit C, partial [Holophagae bacterium]